MAEETRWGKESHFSFLILTRHLGSLRASFQNLTAARYDAAIGYWFGDRGWAEDALQRPVAADWRF